MTEHERREVYLIAGGTPAALALRDRLDDPAFRAELEEGVRRFAEGLRLAVESVLPEFLRQAEAIGRAAEGMRAVLREAGVLPEEPPTDPRARALWLRQHRGTGPDRQLQHARRPRRVP